MYGGNPKVPPIVFTQTNGISHNSWKLYAISCPSPLAGFTILAPPQLAIAAGQTPKLGKPLNLTYPAGITFSGKNHFAHVVTGQHDTVTAVTPSKGMITVTLPNHAKGLVWISVTRSSTTGGYSGPSDTNLDLAPFPVNPMIENCPGGLFVC